MPFSVVQTGDELKLVSELGVMTDLSLPAGVTLATNLPPRWAVSGRHVVLVNSPSQPLTIDGEGRVRLLTPRAPRLGPILSGVSGGALSGTFLARYTFVVVDGIGNVVAESDYSPLSNTVTITTDYLKAANLDLSQDEISLRRLYRSTTDGAVLFQWTDLDGNVLTEVQDDLSDAGLSLFAAPTLGSAPYLTAIAEFRGRLFGVPGDAFDNLRYTEAGLKYAWPSDNVIPIQPVGSDQFGVTGLMARRDAMGVGRRNQLWSIVGDGSEDSDGVADLQPVRLSEILGVLSQESIDVFRDTAYFLWYDGVYQWNSEGISCLSDGVDSRGNVRSWFTTDDYFDRTQFPHAFGKVDPIRHVYRLFLKTPEGETRWVEYDIRSRTWWGPHKTDAFTPISMFTVTQTDGSSSLAPTLGTFEGDLQQEQATRTDPDTTAIAMDVVGKRHDGGDPDVHTHFGNFTVLGKPQASGTLLVKTVVGELEENSEPTHKTTMRVDLAKSRNQMGVVGDGRHAEVRFLNAEVGVDVEVHGYEIDSVHPIGTR